MAGPWILLTIAICMEVAGTTCMKLSDGFSKLSPSILIFVFYAASFAVFTLALKRIDISVAYAVWAGVGTALTAVVGFVYFKDSVTALKIASLGLIIVGVVGLNLSGAVE